MIQISEIYGNGDKSVPPLRHLVIWSPSDSQILSPPRTPHYAHTEILALGDAGIATNV